MRLPWVLPLSLVGAVLSPSAVTHGQSAETCSPAASIPVTASDNRFDKSCYASPAGVPFKVVFTNKDPFSHNFSIYKREGGESLFQGEYVPKASTVTYDVPKQKDGSYYFQCDIHPFMNGTFLVGKASSSTTPSRKATRAPAGPAVNLVKIADGFVAPVFSTGAVDGSGRLFIVDQIGQIRVVDKSGHLLETPFLDIKNKLVKQKPNYDERGLLGLAFHPDYKTNGRFFVWYSAPLRPTAPKGWDNTIHLSEFRASPGSSVADPNSERIILEIDHPQANHNSGHIAFGPDGYLYLPIGDGGNANDVGLGHPPLGNAQDLTTILGNILRIDVDHSASGKNYSIPADNPYATGERGARPEIFANGFRNPYHISFDAGGAHALYAADAGQDRFEEVDEVVKGGNYGWHIKEGTHCFDPKRPSFAPETCATTGPAGESLVGPVIEYNHTEILGSVVIGGYVYRGKAAPELAGKYIFGDYSRDRIKPDGTIFAATPAQHGLWPIAELQIRVADDPDPGPGFGRFVVSFGQGDDHEIYVGLTGRGGPEGTSGAVYRLTAASPAANKSSGALWAVIAGAIVVTLSVLAILALRRRKEATKEA